MKELAMRTECRKLAKKSLNSCCLINEQQMKMLTNKLMHALNLPNSSSYSDALGIVQLPFSFLLLWSQSDISTEVKSTARPGKLMTANNTEVTTRQAFYFANISFSQPIFLKITVVLHILISYSHIIDIYHS